MPTPTCAEHQWSAGRMGFHVHRRPGGTPYQCHCSAAGEASAAYFPSRSQARANHAQITDSLLCEGKGSSSSSTTTTMLSSVPRAHVSAAAQQCSLSAVAVVERCMCCLQAYIPWQDDPKSTLGSCLDNLGIDLDSMTTVHKVVLPYLGTMTAVVMRAGNKGVFVSFR